MDGQIALSIGEWMGQTAFIMTKLLVSGWGRLLSLSFCAVHCALDLARDMHNRNVPYYYHPPPQLARYLAQLGLQQSSSQLQSPPHPGEVLLGA